MCVWRQDLNRDFLGALPAQFWKNFWRVRDLAGCRRGVASLRPVLAGGQQDADVIGRWRPDLLFTGVIGEEAAGNVAEACRHSVRDAARVPTIRPTVSSFRPFLRGSLGR